MARLIIKEERKAGGRTISKATEYYVADEIRDFHTEHGAIPKATLKKGGSFALGKERFRILPATFPDSYARLKRGVQIVTPKDLGLIICETGISSDSVVLDIGFGSGAVTAFLARIVKQVYAYDIVEKNIEHGLKNLEELGIAKRYNVAKGDAYRPETVPHEAEIDVFILDVPEPWRALATATKTLKPGGWLASYSPCITQSNQFVDALDGKWYHVKTCELIEREWKAKGKAVRPVTKDFSHTAFITFVRKVGETVSLTEE